MIQPSYNRPPRGALLQAAVLDEIIVSHAAQLAIDELGLAMATHPGSKRDRNEDRIAVARIAAPNAETYTVALVCDGVGGSESGDQAAALAITSIIVELAEQRGRPSLKDLAVALVKQADDYVRKELQGRGATTLAMLLATASGHLVCANVGDSRVYSWNPSSKKLDQVTIDDTIENELKDLPGNAVGLIEARGLQGRLSQAVGESGRTADELRVQTYSEERFRFGAVLGSDGLWRAARDFEAAVANAATPTDAIRRAIALANWVGGVDNASLIAIGSVGRLCGEPGAHASPAQGQAEIVLWSASAKVKLLANAGSVEDKPAHVRSKPEKQRKSTKKKMVGTEEESQLKLQTTVDPKEARPRIEVTVSEGPEKGE
jgi:serine/threonine protein phosphatase PrpC